MFEDKTRVDVLGEHSFAGGKTPMRFHDLKHGPLGGVSTESGERRSIGCKLFIPGRNRERVAQDHCPNIEKRGELWRFSFGCYLRGHAHAACDGTSCQVDERTRLLVSSNAQFGILGVLDREARATGRKSRGRFGRNGVQAAAHQALCDLVGRHR